MKWIPFSEQLPKQGDCIATIRLSYPAHYWIGRYAPGDDLSEYWFPVPEIPPIETDEK